MVGFSKSTRSFPFKFAFRLKNEEDEEVCWSCESSRGHQLGEVAPFFFLSLSASSLSLSPVVSTYNLKGIHLVGRVIISPLILNFVCFFSLSIKVAPVSPFDGGDGHLHVWCWLEIAKFKIDTQRRNR